MRIKKTRSLMLMFGYGDFTRNTLKPGKHYTDVRMQQGRVLLDSDWNELVDIEAHRTETETVDVIGQHGGPAGDAGFGIVTAKDDLPAEDSEAIEDLEAGDFYITPGRYYVDGILCENESTVRYAKQNDLPGEHTLNESDIINRWLIYLDVWKRHISYIEDPDIREVALSGPDTTTRSKTIWQVKAAKVPLVFINRMGKDISLKALPFGSGCEQLLDLLPADSGGRLTTGRAPILTEDKPCQISPRGGYQGLENRLYRVEIHDKGEPLGWPRPEVVESTDAGRVEGDKKKLKVSVGALEGVSWAKGQIVEVFSEVTDEDSIPGALARIEDIEIIEPDVNLSFDEDITSMVEGESLKLRRVASFKWSRDNGSVTFAIDEFVKKNETDTFANRIRISPAGRDKFLTLRPGDTVEISNDEDDLLERPGILSVVDPASTSDRDGSVVLKTGVPVVDKSLHPKLRRWDYNPDKKAAAEKMAVYPVTLDPVDLEEGIRIQFSGERFRSRDSWSFTARTLSGDVEELQDAPPQGIKHHYAPLAVIDSSGGELKLSSDCRNIFPPLTELTSIYYAGGNGQSSYPGTVLKSPLRARVSAGGMPVAGAPVLFRVISGEGSITQSSPLTDEDGIAEASWTLGGEKSGKQQAEAVLQDGMGNETNKRVFFNADLSLAQEVFYDPKGCTGLDLKERTVQEAIEKISGTAVLNKLSGDNQVAVPNPAAATTKLAEPLVVIVASSCGPIAGALVHFEADDGSFGGIIITTGVADIKTDEKGRASVSWILNNSTERARRTVRASISNLRSDNPVSPPLSEVTFTATLSRASTVAFNPKGCLQGFEEADTVQKALEQLCKMQSKQEPGIVVAKITVGDRPLDNDDKISLGDLVDGIRVVCKSTAGRDDVLATISEASCFVTLNIPFPLSSTDIQLWGRSLKGYQQIILQSGFVSVDGNVIFWGPSDSIDEFLKILFARMRELEFGRRVLAHFTLKGNFIWTGNEPRLYLDGDAFGTRGQNGNNALVLPSGDGRRGGDFEIWFWVESD